MTSTRPLAIAFALLLASCAATDDRELVDELVSQTSPPEPPSAAVRAGAVLQCPLVDTGAGVPSYDGLAGTFRRYGAVPVGEPIRLSLLPVVDDPDARGAFTGQRAGAAGWPAPYAGGFIALADNPAIGAILGLDTDGSGEVDTSYFVLGLHRNLLGQIDAICLLGTAPFQLTRSWF